MSVETPEQETAPNPTTTPWVPMGPGGMGVPLPVTNGQWIKGVGGAAVWAAIGTADLPTGIPASNLAGYPSNTTTFLRGDGSWAAPAPGAGGLLTYRKTTARSALNTNVATDLLNGEITIAANAIGATGILRFEFFGDKLNNSGLTSFCDRYQLIFGGVTLIDTGGAAGTAVLTTAATRYPWAVRGTIANTATNAQVVTFEFLMKTNNTTSANTTAFTTGEGVYDVQATTHMAHAVGYNTGAVDTTAACALVLNVINGTSTATNETKLTSALVEVL